MKKSRGTKFALLAGALVASLLVGLLSSNAAVTLNVLVIGLGLAMVAARREANEKNGYLIIDWVSSDGSIVVAHSGSGPATVSWSELPTPADKGPSLQRAGGDEESTLQPDSPGPNGDRRIYGYDAGAEHGDSYAYKHDGSHFYADRPTADRDDDARPTANAE